VQQTVAIKFKLLSPNRGKDRKMRAAVEVYRQACAWFAGQADRLQTTHRNRMHHETYPLAREAFDLNSATLQEAMFKALTARKSYLTKRSKGDRKAGPPRFERAIPVKVRQDCYRVLRLKSGAWAVKFPVASGLSQIAVPLFVSPYHESRLQELAGGSCRQGAMEFWLAPDGYWYVALSLVYEVAEMASEDVIGVDLGIVKLAVLSNNTFFDGRPVRWRKERWAERRKALQAAGRLSRVKREQGRERRWMKDINHKLSRQMVDQAKR
jgi:transposase